MNNSDKKIGCMSEKELLKNMFDAVCMYVMLRESDSSEASIIFDKNVEIKVFVSEEDMNKYFRNVNESVLKNKSRSDKIQDKTALK